MTVQARLTAVAHDQSELGGPELLPVRVARGCSEVLPVAGAGLSLFSSPDFRVPIGASDDMAAAAERLQFTLGEGPCIAAHGTGAVVEATVSDILRRWPRFHQQLRALTSYRSIISVPLQRALTGFAALDLYLANDAAELGTDWADLLSVADTATAILLAEPLQADAARGGGPAWLDGPLARHRSTVWSAIGMVNVALELTTTDALAVLRGYSYSHDTSVDDTAAALVTRRLSVDALFQDR